MRDLFGRFLGAEGYEIFYAVNGKKAVDRIKEDKLDLLLLDLNMPVMSGMEVIAKVNEAKKDLIMIVVTGYAALDTAKEAIKQGCFDYITKPFDIDEVRLSSKGLFVCAGCAKKIKGWKSNCAFQKDWLLYQ